MLNSILQQTVPLMYYLHTIKYSVKLAKRLSFKDAQVLSKI